MLDPSSVPGQNRVAPFCSDLHTLSGGTDPSRHTGAAEVLPGFRGKVSPCLGRATVSPKFVLPSLPVPVDVRIVLPII